MHPKDISISDYHYELPAEAIALHPLEQRDASRLLIYREGRIAENSYARLADVLPANSLLIFNNTKVVQARIVFTKPTGGQIEIFCLEPPVAYGGMAAAMSQTGTVQWKCLIGGASKWKPGQILTRTIGSEKDSIRLQARYIDKLEAAFLVELSWTPSSLSFAELLHIAGLIPLPPYIRRAPDAADSVRYQTVYAQHDGSVAAPTAGLHFTPQVLESLAGKGIGTEYVTLHVGAGTFLPVKSATMEGHTMHMEYISVSRASIEKLLQWSGPVIPIGTTSARTIESLYWLGVRTIANPGILPGQLVIHQWDAYELRQDHNPADAFRSLLHWMQTNQLTELITRTQLLITPGYRWRVAAALVTNFHQPESTLLLLVASLIGEDWRKVYAHALSHGFRFLSYGDGSLLFPKPG